MEPNHPLSGGTPDPFQSPVELDPDSLGDPGVLDAALVSQPTTAGTVEKPPRWWSPFAVIGSSLALFLFLSGVMSLIAFRVVHGEVSLELLRNPDSFKEVTKSRLGLFILVVIPQVGLIIPPIAAAFASPVPLRERLGLVRGNWPIWAWFGAAAATPLVGMVSGVFVGLFLDESETLKEMSGIFRDHGQSGFLIPLALMIGATPAICEELLFRGYVQTRLTRAFRPAIGVLVASLFFALFHMDLVHVIAVFPLGLFLGVVAWRSGSLFPAMLAHFVNNVISVVAVVFAPEGQTDVLALPIIAISLFVIFAGSTGMLATLAASYFYPPRPADGCAAV